MDAAAVGEDLAGVDQFDGAAGVGLLQDRLGLLVARVVEGAQHDDAVGDVVVDVGVVDGLAVLVEQDGGGGEFDDLQPAALGVGGGAEDLGEPLADRVVGVGRVGLGVDHDGAGADERGDDVDVAAGAELVVVAGESARQPDRLGGAEVGVQLGLDLLAGPVGVAALAELDGVGDQDGALAVDVDAAALVDQSGGEAPDAGQFGDVLGDVLVVVPAGPGLRAPAVEHPVRGGQSAGAVDQEGRADVTHPGVVQRALDDLHLGGDVAAGGLGLAGVDDQGDRLVADDRVGDLGPGAAGGVQLLRAVEGRVRGGEGHPGALVRVPLGGHPEAERGGGGGGHGVQVLRE